MHTNYLRPRRSALTAFAGALCATFFVAAPASAADNCAVAKTLVGKWHFTTRVIQAKSARAYGTNGHYELSFQSVPLGQGGQGQGAQDCILRATLTKTGFDKTTFAPDQRLVGTADATIGSGPAGGAALVTFAVKLRSAKSALDFSFQLMPTKAGIFGSWRYEGAAWKATEMGGLLVAKRGGGGTLAFPENANYCNELLDLVGMDRAAAERTPEAAACAKGLDVYYRRGNASRPAKTPPAPATPPAIAAEGYEACAKVRVVGSDLSEETVTGITAPAGTLAIAPELCGAAPGWAGISMQTSLMALAFSRDGKKLVTCDGTCTITDLQGKAKPQVIHRSTEDVDGTPIVEDPAIAKAVAELGLGDTSGRWLFDDLAVSWSVTKDASAIKFYVVERTTRAEFELATFKAPKGHVVYPVAAPVASDGQTLALAVMFVGDQTLDQMVKTIPVRKAAVRVYQAAAKADREHAKEFLAKAKEAESAH